MDLYSFSKQTGDAIKEVFDSHEDFVVVRCEPGVTREGWNLTVRRRVPGAIVASSVPNMPEDHEAWLEITMYVSAAGLILAPK